MRRRPRSLPGLAFSRCESCAFVFLAACTPATRGPRLTSGQDVRVRSRGGEVTARLEATDAIMPGGVSLPHGYLHASVRIAGAVRGPNIHLLTDEARLELVAGPPS